MSERGFDSYTSRARDWRAGMLRAHLTGERFVADPYALREPDIGPDGEVAFGRGSAVCRPAMRREARGFRIEPGEIRRAAAIWRAASGGSVREPNGQGALVGYVMAAADAYTA